MTLVVPSGETEGSNVIVGLEHVADGGIVILGHLDINSDQTIDCSTLPANHLPASKVIVAMRSDDSGRRLRPASMQRHPLRLEL
jgi:hypothetical protein